MTPCRQLVFWGLVIAMTLFTTTLFSACGGQDGAGNTQNIGPPPAPTAGNAAQGPDITTVQNAPPAPIQSPSPIVSNEGQKNACASTEPNHICLALKCVAFEDSSGIQTLSNESAKSNLEAINKVWSQCNMGFIIEDHVVILPAEFGLKYQIADFADLYEIRNIFSDDKTLLVVSTGAWNRSGSLGSTGANAWTSMPGGGPYGVVLEQPVSTYTNIIAHELGHYLNLLHATDVTALMNPIIYSTSDQLSVTECDVARAAAQSYWLKMMR